MIYAILDMGLAVGLGRTSATNRVDCFDGVVRSAVAANWVVALSADVAILLAPVDVKGPAHAVFRVARNMQERGQ